MYFCVCVREREREKERGREGEREREREKKGKDFERGGGKGSPQLVPVLVSKGYSCLYWLCVCVCVLQSLDMLRLTSQMRAIL